MRLHLNSSTIRGARPAGAPGVGRRVHPWFRMLAASVFLAPIILLAEDRAASWMPGIVPEISVERLGEPIIEPQNNFSENTQIRIRLTFPAGHARAGQLMRGYGRPIRIEEWNTRIYDGLHGATRLPMTVRAPDGTLDITLKSLARYTMYDLRNMPIPKIAVHIEGQTRLLQVPQWVDADGNDKTDWLEQRVEDILRRARASTEQVVAGAAQALEGWEQSYKRDCGGFDEQRPAIILVSPACLDWDGTNAHRLNADSELTATVLHELRHVWVFRNSGKAGRRQLLKAPPWPLHPAPCDTLNPDAASCTGHVWVQDPRYPEQEADAEAFAEQYKHLFP